MAWYRTYLRTDRKRDAKTATGDYGFLRSLYQSEGALAARWRSLRNFFHYLGIEMVAWQLHSDDLTASPSSQGKMLHTMLHNACDC